MASSRKQKAREPVQAMESERIRQNDGESKLTARQKKFLPILLASPTYAEACRKGRASHDTLYAWLKEPGFRAEYRLRRDELAESALGVLAQSMEQAVASLIGLLDTGDERVRRLTAKDVIGHFCDHKRLVELEERVGAIEERLGHGRP